MRFAAPKIRNSLLLTCLGIILACTQTKFKSEEKPQVPPPEPENHIVPINGINDLDDAGERVINNIDTVDFTITATAAKIVETKTDTLHPVDLYFVVDSSGSMEDEIAQVKLALIKISEQLKERGVDLWAGFIGFVDNQDSIENNRFHKLTDDLEGLKTFIEGVSTKGNQDNPEGSLMAAKYALDRLLAGDGRKNATKTIVLITDVVGHNGGDEGLPTEVTRDCTLTAVKEKIGALAADLQDEDRVKFYYAVPDPANLPNPNPGDVVMANHTCSVSIDGQGPEDMNVKAQMNQLLDNILPTIRKENRGGPLLDQNGNMPWPLAENSLVDTLVPLLESTRPEKQSLQCAASSAKVFSGDKEIYTWEAKSIAATLATPKNSILLDDVISEAIKREDSNNPIRFEIGRCCVDVSSETPNSCVKEYTQKVNYRIVDDKK